MFARLIQKNDCHLAIYLRRGRRKQQHRSPVCFHHAAMERTKKTERHVRIILRDDNF